jgi:uracil-DNA glycosylase
MTSDDNLRKTRLEALAELYDEIWEWARTKYDHRVVKRRIEAVGPDSCLFIVGEAHAEDQVRLTGINWFDAQGTPGASGKYLNAILRCLDYTVHPPTTIHLSRGSVGPKRSGLTTAYSTDIFPCYPPGGGSPTKAMVNDALEQRFLTREFDILKPKVVLLLGRHSYKAFYRYLLRRVTTEKISETFALLSPSTEFAEYNGALVVPFLHPSPESGIFSHWFRISESTLCEQPQLQAIAAALTR